MNTFPIHTPVTASAEAAVSLQYLEDAIGFIPNVFAAAAEAQPVLSSMMNLMQNWSESSFTDAERELVSLAISVDNHCNYCTAGHTAFACFVEAPDDAVQAIRQRLAIVDEKISALIQFARRVHETRGVVSQTDWSGFLSAGYTQQQGLELCVGIVNKVLSNLVSHMTQIPLDEAFAQHAWHEQAVGMN
ncbi:MAG: carboxymuconolactone decarboxylase family protein [Planctomycetes bacterium]|nr:carboxymuconolactone decarboxylase family protein [Planctomycetota bacterium]